MKLPFRPPAGQGCVALGRRNREARRCAWVRDFRSRGMLVGTCAVFI